MAYSKRPSSSPKESSGEERQKAGDVGDMRSPKMSKVVSIAEPEIDSISPMMKGKPKDLDQLDSLDLDRTARLHRASVSSRRLTGRPSLERLGSYPKVASLDGNPSLTSLLSEGSDPTSSRHPHHEHFLKQVGDWLKNEKARRAARKAKRKAAHVKDAAERSEHQRITEKAKHALSVRSGHESDDSDEGSAALDQLAFILERSLSMKSTDSSSRLRRFSHGRKLSAAFKRSSVASSGAEDYFDSIDQLVPSCEAILDNSKTLAYDAGSPEGESVDPNAVRCSKKDKEAWNSFKYEITRLAHTLRLKGWRRVPLDLSSKIGVARLSGALTNAVYVVSPPEDLGSQGAKGETSHVPKNPPPKLLLRIYGPQSDHLIDRESELRILRRLARKRIGPRLLGTFTNGRFEEFFQARPLTPQEMRTPDTSKQIAKRMRELHEGIDLLEEERTAGPFVWRNWDKWVDRVEQVAMWLDEQIIEGKQGPVLSASDRWKKRGLVCGVPWPIFRKVVEKYRTWLYEQYGGQAKVNERLVFAHNDTQYGNILRMTPAGESPLLLPANEHKQLIVIDFEYANANLPGLEFANHFTEWCYNYHDPDHCTRCHTPLYPSPEEQHRFICAYLMHTPTFKAPSGSGSHPCTPHLGPLLPTSGSSVALAATAPSTSISAFVLDARAPPGERYSYELQEAQVEANVRDEAERLMAETRLWRLANSAHWVAWGFVQAHVPGMPGRDEEEEEESKAGEKSGEAEALHSATEEVGEVAKMEREAKEGDGVKGDTTGTENDKKAAEGDEPDVENEEEEEEEYDYLGYAQDRAMFVWGDAIRLGIIQPEELPEDVLKRVRMVEY